MTFDCPECGQFDSDWSYGNDVQCPICQKWWKTDYDFSISGEEGEMLMGPWIDGRSEEQHS